MSFERFLLVHLQMYRNGSKWLTMTKRYKHNIYVYTLKKKLLRRLSINVRSTVTWELTKS